MKKCYFFLLTVLILNLTSCDLFLNGSNFRNQLEDKMNYATESEHLSVTKFSPAYTDFGVYEKSPVIITFNKAVDTKNFCYEISFSKKDLTSYYEEPLFSENNTKVIFYPVMEKNISELFINNSEMDVEFKVLQSSLAEDGTHLDKELKSFFYKINNKRETEKPVLEEISFFRTKEDVEKINPIPLDENNVYENARSLWINCKGYDTGSGIKSLLVKETLLKNVKGQEYNILAQTDEHGYGAGDFAYLNNGTGYKNGIFEYAFNSQYDGLVELEFKLVDNCGNESNPVKMQVYKDTEFSCSRWSFVNQNQVKCYHDSGLTYVDEFIDVDECEFKFINLTEDVYFEGKSGSINDLKFKVEYGYDEDNLIYSCDADFTGFKLINADRSKDIYIKVTIYDSIGNCKSISRYLPCKPKVYGIEEVSLGRYRVFYKNSEDRKYSTTLHFIYPSSEEKLLYNDMSKTGIFSTTIDLKDFNSKVYIYEEVKSFGSEEPIFTLSAPFEVNSSSLLSSGISSDYEMPDFTCSYKSKGIGSELTRVELTLDLEEINKKGYDQVFATLEANSMNGACFQTVLYDNSNIWFDLETASNTGEKNDSYGFANTIIQMIGIKNGQKYSKKITIPYKSFEYNLLGQTMFLSNYGKRIVYNTEINSKNFAHDSNNQIKYSIYYSLFEEELDNRMVYSGNNPGLGIINLRNKGFYTPEQIKKFNKIECAAACAPDEDALFEFDLPDLIEGKYILFIEVTDAEGIEYCDVLGLYSNFDSGSVPNISKVDETEVELQYKINQTNKYGSPSYSYNVFWTVDVFENGNWENVTDCKAYSSTGGAEGTIMTKAFPELKDKFFRVCAMEAYGSFDLKYSSSYCNYYFSDITYGLGVSKENRHTGSLIPVYGGYTPLSENVSLLQTYYSSVNYGDSLEKWERCCDTSQKVNPKVVKPFETYKVDSNQIPENSYYVVVSYFSDGTSAISEVNYK